MAAAAADIEAASTETMAERAWRAGDHVTATNVVFSSYGGEIYGFLMSQFRGQPHHADEAFSMFTEDFWRALPAFEWRCSIRAWCYRLARSASSRYRRSPHNRRARQIPLSDVPFLSSLEAVTRSSTQAHLRSEVKDEIYRLREMLSRDDQDLLVLRVDRGLSWREVAHAMGMADDEPEAEVRVDDEQRQRRDEAALRQRFAEVKKRLRSLAETAGLLK